MEGNGRRPRMRRGGEGTVPRRRCPEVRQRNNQHGPGPPPLQHHPRQREFDDMKDAWRCHARAHRPDHSAAWMEAGGVAGESDAQTDNERQPNRQTCE